MKKIVALLPLKINSERVKGKNFREFNGKPLYRWVLETLLDSNNISYVCINTDAVEILKADELCNDPRVILEPRPEAICGDLVSMNKIIEHDIEKHEADMYLMTHVTNPLLSKETVDAAISCYFEHCITGKYDSVFSVNKVQARFYDSDANPINHNPQVLQRTQDLDPYYEENSNIYIFSKNGFQSTGGRIGQRPRMFVTPFSESIDIDNQEDWDMAQALHHYKFLKKGS